MDNKAFLNAIKQSFDSFIASGTSRSTQKLKPLHGAIARDLKAKLGPAYLIKSQGYGDDKEGSLQGRYVDKAVDITIYKHSEPVAGVAVKFVMQNYAQNSVNYFENMLGETANIRSNGYPYFQIFIILDKIPYYEKGGVFKHWEIFTPHNIAKYAVLSKDNVDDFRHTPNKTLVFVAHVTDCGAINAKADYLSFYRSNPYTLSISPNSYTIPGSAVILNDYETFMDKVYHTIEAL